MASPRALRWIERLTWTLIYGGLFSVVIGLAVLDNDPLSAWALVAAGGIVAGAGVALIWLRSRLSQAPP